MYIFMAFFIGKCSLKGKFGCTKILTQKVIEVGIEQTSIPTLPPMN